MNKEGVLTLIGMLIYLVILYIMIGILTSMGMLIYLVTVIITIIIMVRYGKRENKLISLFLLWSVLLVCLFILAGFFNYTDHTKLNRLYPTNASNEIVGIVGDATFRGIENYDITARRVLKEINTKTLIHLGDIVKSYYMGYAFELFNAETEKFNNIYHVVGNHDVDIVPFTLSSINKNYTNMMKYTNIPSPYYTFVINNTKFIVIDTNLNITTGSEQYVWLEEQLKQTEKDFTIVLGHHPPHPFYSNPCEPRCRDRNRSRAVLNYVIPLMKKYKTDALISGHQHIYEQRMVEGVLSIISGGGNNMIYHYPNNFNGLPIIRSLMLTGHYILVEFNKDKLILRVYQVPNVLYDVIIIEKKGD